MRLGTAIEHLVEAYKYASDKEWIQDKVAWALYHTWKEADRKTDQMTDDLIRKSDVLETYADLYDIFDDNKAIQEELHKVFDKINDIPAVEPKDEPQTEDWHTWRDEQEYNDRWESE